MTSAPPRATVAVVSYNTVDLLRRCMRSLEADALSGRAEVWVVDNDSADGSADAVEAEFEWAQLIRSGENLGFGPAVNRAAEHSRAEWLVAANADIALEPGALAALLDGAKPRDGIVAPTLVMPDGEVQHSVHPFPTIRLALLVAFGVHRRSRMLGERLVLEGAWNPARARQVDWAHGALLAIRRAAFDEIDGFDDRQWMYAEDLDVAWRLSRRGWTTGYVPAARVLHEVSAAAREAFDDREARHFAASYAWMARRRGLAYTRIYAMIGYLGAGTRAAILAPAALLLPRWFGARRRRWRRWMALHRIGLQPRGALLAGGERPALP